jgi:CRP/FNR family cyclic AMP-dependent transcriptional regulator
MQDDKIREYLQTIRDEMIFSLFDDSDLDNIAPFFELRIYPGGRIVFEEGDTADFVGLVASGKLEVKKQTEFKGNQVIIAILGPGALFGEMSIFDNNRSATIEAVEDSTIFILTNTALNTMIEQYPYTGIKLLKGLIRILSIRLRKITERLTTIF